MKPIAAAGVAEPGLPADAVEVGRIAGAWGVKGWIRVRPYNRDPKALFASREWFIASDELPDTVARMRCSQRLRITASRTHGDDVVAAASEVPDRDAAQALHGARVFVSRASFPRTGDDEYYWVDLIGLEVVNREGHVLGRVSGLLDTGVHSVLRVLPADGGNGIDCAERLIPFVAAHIDSVDLESRRIVADWGLDY